MANHERLRQPHARERNVLVSDEACDYVIDFLRNHCSRDCRCHDEDGGHRCSVIVEAGHKALVDAVVGVRDCSGEEVRFTRKQKVDLLRHLDPDMKLDLLAAAGLATNARISRAIEAESRRLRRRGVDMEIVYADVVCHVAGPPTERGRASRPARHPAARAPSSSGAVAASASVSGDEAPGSPPPEDAPSSPRSALAGEAVRP